MDTGEDSLSVLVEGYTPREQRRNVDSSFSFDSQVVVKIDWDASPTGTTKVIVVVSYLSIAAFVRPLQDLVQFFACAWPVMGLSGIYIAKPAPINEMASDQTSMTESKAAQPLAVNIWELRFVAHYPRLIFAADESDPHSRALLLRGYVLQLFFHWCGSVFSSIFADFPFPMLVSVRRC